VLESRIRLLATACVLGLAVAVSGLACDTALHPGDADAPVSASCLEAVNRSDLPWIADHVFRPSCALSTSCHSGARPAGGLDLSSAARAHQNLVGVAAASEADRVRVVPGDPQASYVMVKLGVVPGPLGDGGTRMPPNSPPICSEKLGAVERWIAAGAPGTTPDAGASDAAVDASSPPPVDAGSIE
jgi:hypothetical protein